MKDVERFSEKSGEAEQVRPIVVVYVGAKVKMKQVSRVENVNIGAT